MDQQIEQLFANSLVIDGLMSYYFLEDPDCSDADCSHYPIKDFGQLKTLTGIDCGAVTVSNTIELPEEHAVVFTYESVTRNPSVRVVRKGTDIENAWREGKFGVLLYAQKHESLNGSVDNLKTFQDKGLRIFQLAYNARIDPQNTTPEEMLAGGSDQPDQGLTQLGKDIVRELNRLNMIVDVSHLSKPSVMETVALSKAPVLANHTNAKTITDSPRNKSDEELLAIASTDGVIGLTPIKWMISRTADGEAGIDDFIAHLDYIVDLVGIDHVGIASDSSLNGWWKSSRHYADEDMAAVDRWKRVAGKLIEIKDTQGTRKYSDLDLKKILGLNFLRVFKEVLI